MAEKLTLFLLISITLFEFSFPKTSEEWKSRSIYQLLTDRFAKTDGSTTPCTDLHKYCGGTWQGITNNLDYIAGMGFDAIWISPFVKNMAEGYHGYWQIDLYKVNEHFGTEEDLNNLIKACHARSIYIYIYIYIDIWVMADVVANHIAPVGFNYTTIYPFDKDEYYHSYCIINSGDFKNDQWKVENCRLADLPDLKQENSFVNDELLKYAERVTQEYNFDGMRIDTVPEVPKSFWKEWKNVSNCHTMGEVFDDRVEYVKGYLDILKSNLNYPLFWPIRFIFNGRNSFWQIVDTIRQETENYGDYLDYMGMFIDNHDNERFLNKNFNIPRFKGALAFSMIFRGIPIIYYGDEQLFKGGGDPYCREPLWTSMDPNAEVYKFLRKVNDFRKKHKIWNLEYKEIYYDDHCFVFARGNILAVFSNTDYEQNPTVRVPFPDGTKYCNYLATDCVTVSGGNMSFKVAVGETKLYEPSSGISTQEYQ